MSVNLISAQLRLHRLKLQQSSLGVFFSELVDDTEFNWSEKRALITHFQGMLEIPCRLSLVHTGPL